MGADWRIDNASRLRGQSSRWKDYYARSASWDHDHCAACWAKFMLTAEGSLSQGYAVSEKYEHGLDYTWVCADCFRDLANIMDWHVID
jgi:hypothetical protein